MYSNIILIMIHMFLYLTKLITHSAHLECASLYIAHLANMPIYLHTQEIEMINILCMTF